MNQQREKLDFCTDLVSNVLVTDLSLTDGGRGCRCREWFSGACAEMVQEGSCFSGSPSVANPILFNWATKWASRACLTQCSSSDLLPFTTMKGSSSLQSRAPSAFTSSKYNRFE